MNIALIIPSLDAGGAERVISSLANYWSEEGHQIHLYVFSDEQFYLINPKVNLRVIDLQSISGRIQKGIFLLKTIVSLRKDFKKNNIECIVSFTTFNNVFFIFLSKLVNIPIVISERCDPQLINTSCITIFLRRWIYRYANAIVLQTENSISSFQRAKIKLPITKAIIFNPLSGGFKNLSKGRRNILLSVGRLSSEKGHDLLLKAFKYSDITDWELWIIGDGPLLEELKRYALQLDISDRVKFLGRQKNVLKYYNLAPIFILPSRSEGFPNVLCEAMACGCGVISFDCPNGPSEIIRDGVNGLLVKNGDIKTLSEKMTILITDRALLEKISKEAVKITNSLDIQHISRQWLGLIKSVSLKKDNFFIK